jgi:plasmid replication initiation protein
MIFLKRWFVYLTLWKDAGTGIAEVEDVRKRLAGLKSH